MDRCMRMLVKYCQISGPLMRTHIDTRAHAYIHKYAHTLTHMHTHTGSRGVHLEMSASNTRALKFYLKFGFTVQEFDSDDEAGEPPEDTFIMASTP